MIELIKKEIHMNRQRGTAVSQLTLDDDFIVPDALDDAVQILLSDGEVQIENSRIQGEKVLIRGKLVFRVLYRRESGGLQAMGGEIPFEETVNVPELSERDYTQIVWNIEDLNITMIHSRKLSAKAVLTLTVRAESRVDAQAAADVETDDAGLQVLKRSVPAATLAVRRKDIYRVREEVSVSANKPNIETILWQEMRLRDVSVRPLDGKLHLDGELSVFLIYSGEGEHTPVQWLEESIPFSGEVELSEAVEEMIPAVGVRILHAEAGKKPDSDGEMREVEVEAVLELVRQVRDRFGVRVSELNLGGGFGITYTTEERRPYRYYLDPMLERIAACFDALELPRPAVVIEPGRSIVGDAALSLYTVGAIKEIAGVRKYVAVDGGMTDNIRPALYQAVYRGILANKADAAPAETVTVCGKCCESGDILLRDAALPAAESGDILAVLSTGAYGYSMASNYNSNPIPAVVLVKDGRDELMVRRQSYEDLIRNDL